MAQTLFNRNATFCSIKCYLIQSLNFIIKYFLVVQIKSNTPVLMCSVPGYDASGRVDDLVAQQNKPCTSIAIGKLIQFLIRNQNNFQVMLNHFSFLGSAEGFSLTEKAINSAVKSGRYLYLQCARICYIVNYDRERVWILPFPTWAGFVLSFNIAC